ncbi:hypothetical protein FA95DRAFT_1602502 [Auriscalpium vulgare]|uniref:Uncharacterized protein n=1 Tax=Auriscalpium vulgare TaxID=40419 RepID=A0ACB8S7E8_9AGAM|nr:hypothetical protein FA95DRAFT_1602502 [Auriscalpium vulgare]
MSPYPPRPSTHRRRSLSASASASPSSSRRILDDPWRPSTKRAHPAPSSRDLALPHKWDVDLWRRGKRPRMDQTPSPPSPADMDIEYSSMQTPFASPRKRKHTFASTSAAFNFFPARSPRTSTSSPPHPKPPSPTHSELSAMHSNAFCDLARSVTENGDGLVQRMRAFEAAGTGIPHPSLRSQPPPSAYHRRGRPSPPRSPVFSLAGDEENVEEDEDEDDVQIFSGDASEHVPLIWASSPPKKRARSLGQMDLDSPPAPLPIPIARATPALSHTVSSSTNSSLVSLPLAFAPGPADVASREEKAIAALNLALASGAASLVDYGAVQEALGVRGLGASEDISEVGEMWH